ncbi:hypothetical protein DCAR_0102000 [Daucus carota subsp. sativus]|uniref:Uncharacterized protein n=1 Tax=Daucus carota subsp. sativus TaxID=79200 RepID=A0A166GT27_DAUCS|nr:hypothetical protein DCAR_0102000 [Daucus carota subsp. sativus]
MQSEESTGQYIAMSYRDQQANSEYARSGTTSQRRRGRGASMNNLIDSLPFTPDHGSFPPHLQCSQQI